MKKTKTQKGITLIALIITIVVLLVLASVAINSIQNDGIIGHAQSTKDQFEQAQKDEQDVLDHYELILAGKAWEVGAPETVNGVEKIPVTTAKSEKVYVGDTVAYDPTATTTTANLLNNEESSVKLAANDELTKYTANPSETGSSYTFKYEAKNTVKWRVLGAENGKLLLVSDASVAKYYGTNTPAGTELTNYALQLKEKGYKNGLNILQNIANIYSHGKGVVGARVLNHSDINRLSGYNPEVDGWYKGTMHEYGNVVTITLSEGNVLTLVGSNNCAPITIDLDTHSLYSKDKTFWYYNEQTGEKTALKVGETITIKNTYYNTTYGTDNTSPVYQLLAIGEGNDDRRILLGDRMCYVDGDDVEAYYRYSRLWLNDSDDGANKGYKTHAVTLFYSSKSDTDSIEPYAFNSLRIVVEVDPNIAFKKGDDGKYLKDNGALQLDVGQNA